MEITLLLIASCSLLQMTIGKRTQSKSRYQQGNVRFRSHAVGLQFPYWANKPSPRGLLYNELGSVEHADNSVAGGGEGGGGVGGRRWTQCGNYKKLSYCWETVRRDSMPRIADMDVKWT